MLCYSLNSKRYLKITGPLSSISLLNPSPRKEGSKFFIILDVMNINITKIRYPQLKDTRTFSNDWVIFPKLPS